MARFLLEFDLSRRKAAAMVSMGCVFPDGFVSISRMANAALFRNEKSLLLAGFQRSRLSDGGETDATTI